jgi:hypothetical protein
MEPIRIRAVLFEEADWWVGQCLEYDIAVQARTKPKLKTELANVLQTHVIASAAFEQRPFGKLGTAPQKYFDMYEAARYGGSEEQQIIEPPKQPSHGEAKSPVIHLSEREITGPVPTLLEG